MVEAQRSDLDAVFSALAHPTRRRILCRLGTGHATVGELAELFPVSLNAVSKHVKVLERAELVDREVRGREHHLSADTRPLRKAGEWIAHYARFWERVDALEAMLEEEAD